MTAAIAKHALRPALIIGGVGSFIDALAPKLARFGLAVTEHWPSDRVRDRLPGWPAVAILFTDITGNGQRHASRFKRDLTCPLVVTLRKESQWRQDLERAGFTTIPPVAGAANNNEEIGMPNEVQKLPPPSAVAALVNKPTRNWNTLVDALVELVGEMREQGLRELLVDEHGNLDAKRVEVVSITRRVGG